METDRDFDIVKEEVERALEPRSGDFTNKILYDLCRAYPCHTRPDVVEAKLCIIGRAYAASIERRRNKHENEPSEQFYAEVVGPKVAGSQIDKWLDAIKPLERADEGNLKQILDVHAKVTNLFFEISKLVKRSLASKYLHFHFPKAFFIFDGRAKIGVSHIRRYWRCPAECADQMDREYEIFCRKVLKVREYVHDKWGVLLCPRQIDRLLLDKASEKE